mmetsp:Transcript_38617/g.36971  ORF Transcript_38617/g.36971 Transcript_38617/m.36971 type:complete len:94 (+) Transcript_38617:87-368(+)
MSLSNFPTGSNSVFGKVINAMNNDSKMKNHLSVGMGKYGTSMMQKRGSAQVKLKKGMNNSMIGSRNEGVTETYRKESDKKPLQTTFDKKSEKI